MDTLEFLRARLKIEQDELAQLTAGTLRIHRRTADGQFVDESAQDIGRVRQLIEGLEAQIRHLERQRAAR